MPTSNTAQDEQILVDNPAEIDCREEPARVNTRSSSARQSPLRNNTSTGSGSGTGTGTESQSTDRKLKGLELSFWKKVAVGSGHIENDLCGSLWFSYFLLYFENVAGLSSNYTAYLMTLGQIVDGIATPVVGYEADHTSHCIFFRSSYGRCKTWHLFGVITVALAFPFIFTPCIACEDAEDWAKLIYYAPFIIIIQMGWGCTQISHLALIPKMSPNELVRTEILAIRYGFTVMSNITIFLLVWYFVGVNAGEIDSGDAINFRNLTVIAMGIGLVFSIIFHITVKEETDDYVKTCVGLRSKLESKSAKGKGQGDMESKRRSSSRYRRAKNRFIGSYNRSDIICPELDTSSEDTWSDDTDSDSVNDNQNSSVDTIVGTGTGTGATSNNTAQSKGRNYSLSTKCLSLGKDHMKAGDWLKNIQFYSVALIYMMTRLSVNLTQAYVPLYLQKSLKLPSVTVATVPLTMYIFGFIVAMFMKPISRLLGRQFSYSFGALMIVVGSICILTLELKGCETIVSKFGIYVVAALMGSGASVLLVTSLSIAADLIGNNVESGAFVYGAMSFTDKFACGVAFLFINSIVPCQKDDMNCSASDKKALGIFYKNVLAYAAGGCAVIGVVGVTLATLIIFLTRASQVQQNRRRF